MKKEEEMDQIFDLLEKPAYTGVLLCIIGGKNYATSIAKHLGKKQPTVTEQLKELEKLGLIKPLKREKSQRYEVNWDILLHTFYDIINEVLDERSEYIAPREIKRIEKIGLEKIVPPELLKIFLKEYFLTLMDIGGKKKGFDEIVFSFFAALNNLNKRQWRKLIKKFEVDEKSLLTLANLMEFEISGVELTALQTYLEFSGRGEKSGKPVPKGKNS